MSKTPRVRANKDIRDPVPVFDNKLDQFKYWFTNVYWFHYKWPTVFVLIMVAVVVSIIHGIVTRKDPDVVVVISAELYFDHSYAAELESQLLEIVKEVTGNEEAAMEFNVLDIDYGSEVGQANAMLLTVNMTRDDTLLFILGQDIVDTMLEADVDYVHLEPYGFGDNYWLDVSDSPKIKKLIPGQEGTFIAGFLKKEVKNESIYDISAAILAFLAE